MHQNTKNIYTHIIPRAYFLHHCGQQLQTHRSADTVRLTRDQSEQALRIDVSGVDSDIAAGVLHTMDDTAAITTATQPRMQVAMGE